MTDPFDALRPPRRPLPAGGDDRAVARGRRIIHRRRAAASGAAAAGLLAVGSVVAFSDGDRKPDSVGVLSPDRPGRTSPDAVASPEPSPTAAARPSSTPAPQTVSAPTLPPLPGQSPRPRPTQTTPPPSDRPYIGPEPTADDGAAIYTETTYTDPNGCLNKPRVMVGETSGFCISTDGPATVTAGKRETFAVTFCRTLAAGDVTLHFSTRLEAWITFSAGHYRYFGFGDTLSGPAHTQVFKAGDCTRYSTTWSGQDQDGYALPEGKATVLSVLLATDYHDNNQQNPGMFTNTDVRWS